MGRLMLMQTYQNARGCDGHGTHIHYTLLRVPAMRYIKWKDIHFMHTNSSFGILVTRIQNSAKTSAATICTLHDIGSQDIACVPE